MQQGRTLKYPDELLTAYLKEQEKLDAEAQARTHKLPDPTKVFSGEEEEKVEPTPVRPPQIPKYNVPNYPPIQPQVQSEEYFGGEPEPNPQENPVQ